MIRAMAYGGQVLGSPKYVNAAAKAAQFLLKHHRAPDGGLYRTSRDGQRLVPEQAFGRWHRAENRCVRRY